MNNKKKQQAKRIIRIQKTTYYIISQLNSDFKIKNKLII